MSNDFERLNDDSSLLVPVSYKEAFQCKKNSLVLQRLYNAMMYEACQSVSGTAND